MSGTLDAERLFVPGDHSLAPVYTAPVSVTDVPRDRATARSPRSSRASARMEPPPRSRARRRWRPSGGRTICTSDDAMIVATRADLFGVVDMPGSRSSTVKMGQINSKGDGWALLGA